MSIVKILSLSLYFLLFVNLLSYIAGSSLAGSFLQDDFRNLTFNVSIINTSQSTDYPTFISLTVNSSPVSVDVQAETSPKSISYTSLLSTSLSTLTANKTSSAHKVSNVSKIFTTVSSTLSTSTVTLPQISKTLDSTISSTTSHPLLTTEASTSTKTSTMIALSTSPTTVTVPTTVVSTTVFDTSPVSTGYYTTESKPCSKYSQFCVCSYENATCDGIYSQNFKKLITDLPKSLTFLKITSCNKPNRAILFDDDLKGFTSLQSITINKCLNQTSFLSRHIFENQEKLIYLDLSFNQLKFTNDWGVHKTVKHLNLSHNQIAFSSAKFSQDFPNLELLDLSYNLMKELPNKLNENFHKLAKLKTLSLSNNGRSLGTQFANSDTSRIFENLTSLETLHLSNLGISKLDEKIFCNNKKLTNLDLSKNSFGSNLGFLKCALDSQLNYLDFSYNSDIDYLEALYNLLTINSSDASVAISLHTKCRCYFLRINDPPNAPQFSNIHSSCTTSKDITFIKKSIMGEAKQCLEKPSTSSAKPEESSAGAVIGIFIIILIILLVLIGLAFYKFKLCSRYKSWRVKIRYKGVREPFQDDGAVELAEMEHL